MDQALPIIIEKLANNTPHSKYEQAEKDLISHFGDIWDSFKGEVTRKSLVSSWIMWQNSSELGEDFDYSGVVICATAALESELGTVIYEPFKEYNDPDIQADDRFKNKVDKLFNKQFTLGNFKYLFESEKYKINGELLFAGNEARIFDELRESFLGSVMAEGIIDKYKDKGVKKYSDCFTKAIYEKRSLVTRIHSITMSFRNNAAHKGNISGDAAKACCSEIFGTENADYTDSILVQIHSLLDHGHREDRQNTSLNRETDHDITVE